MTGIAAASFFSNACRFGGCGLHFPTLAELIEHIEDNHIGETDRDQPTWPVIWGQQLSGSSAQRIISC
uniref:C2H2-type domain-containing protein n=1 Tax=Pavo cristatus TaxID=9049 RepID=A0A8C9G0N0_PAVCR